MIEFFIPSVIYSFKKEQKISFVTFQPLISPAFYLFFCD